MRWQDYLILLLLLGAYIIYLLIGPRRRRGGSRRSREELTRREEAVLRQLKLNGYQLVETHPLVPVTLTVDQKSRRRFNYQGAFTVKKNGKEYLVRIKRDNTSPLNSASLRQEMLLDSLFFQSEGIILYDVEKEKFQELHITFGRGINSSKQQTLQASLIFLIILGVAILYRLIGGS